MTAAAGEVCREVLLQVSTEALPAVVPYCAKWWCRLRSARELMLIGTPRVMAGGGCSSSVAALLVLARRGLVIIGSLFLFPPPF